MSPTLSLARYLRENLALTGTKIMCAQAGCGVCVVTAYVPDASNVKGYKTISINSVTLNFVFLKTIQFWKTKFNSGKCSSVDIWRLR